MAELSLGLNASLFEVPPTIMERFCELMDYSDGELGWKGLAERLSSDWMDFRKIEKCAEQGRSRTKELLWSWAHKNKSVDDLLEVLQEMGHRRAISLFNEINAVSHVSVKEITEATQNFHKDFMIGEGHFFDIFKAEIRKELYAVKLLKQKNQEIDQKALNQFMLKWKSLPRFQHKNIIKLAGCVTMGGITCLVYPNMINGSLFRKLHCAKSTPPLPWHIRYNILVDVAHAIYYLHTRKPYPVLCGNITSKSILLDQHFQPKLSDFAMVHLRSYLINQLYTIKMDQATLQFLGYLPEEYIRRGELSPKTDVYSYGVLIMEVLSGRQAVLNEPNTTYLRDLFWNEMDKSGIGPLLQIVDMKTRNWPVDVAHKLLTISFEATSLRAKQRPTFEMILEMTKSCNKYTEDHPKSLMCFPPCVCRLPLSNPNVPIESDENVDSYFSVHEKQDAIRPCECSQSEVTYLGGTRTCRSTDNFISTPVQDRNTSQSDQKLWMSDLSYTSRPVECSCSSGPDSTSYCEQCLINGFGNAE
ncbi:interleukin-1 receptor-associated kinase 3 [Anomaloglossus baeobatrachus]|uniref:interleukin-1 receptor-associated kinase 3 n=1 Tax=Anomaloglossus baeobatrachus TaxID=238106 RepID=UPI003F4F7CC7